ncbi:MULTISPECIES: hypothetical protein [unclassified Stenotrophomonas]|uniref:hypothetical protein n=1 Tax=unclassified Stenotrophomonas TaxID=196198 RepID=UPI0012F4559E|nr:hypothetical protein [Stenotrophomonas sp. RAC2]ECH9271478.1 hypothetical protein [Salmonella enterica subsp. enterica serovar Litchfield]MCI1050506.1 hypothetical protein [Stenotrophomonas maltophilia]MDV9042745.1 hypothetical protein [Stenotrophomonas sp. RAC2]
MQDPRISLNKLGEYMTAPTPSRRKRIVSDQQTPQPFIAARYKDAREAIVDFIVSGMSDRTGLLSLASQLRKSKEGSEFAINDRIASADAIESFIQAVDQIDLGNCVAVSMPGTISQGMTIAGVYVSVRPDIYLRNWLTGEIEGALKLHFPKTSPLTSAGAEYVATAMRVYMQLEQGNSHVDHRKCYVVDVPTASVTVAPKAHVRKMKDIQAACEEIAIRWFSGSAAA